MSKRVPSCRSRVGTLIYRYLGLLPISVPGTWSPVFLLGCGRSGTTITGRIIGQHPDVCVLNEPRHIWRAALPETDIWHAQPGCRMELTAADIDPRQLQWCRRMFYLRHRASGRKLLVEKLPVNSFRLSLLERIFDNCQFIHVVRHGLEVAHSIARTADRWYGANDGLKWKLLIDLAVTRGWSRRELEQCHDSVSRGLLEWTLSVRSVRELQSRIPPRRFFEVRYDDLVRNPADETEKLLEYLGLTFQASVMEWAKSNVRRRHRAADQWSFPENISPETADLIRQLDRAGAGV